MSCSQEDRTDVFAHSDDQHPTRSYCFVASRYAPDHPGISGAWFIETMTQFGTFVPSEKGYHCTSVRDPAWPVWWGGNGCINLHREGSVELLMLALDYWDHTQDREEFATSILPLSVAVTDWVRTYFGRDNATGLLDVWPTQSLEGYQARFPPTRDSIINNDMPMVAGLHAVLPRLLIAGAENGVAARQLSIWADLLAVLPPLPTTQVSPQASARVQSKTGGAFAAKNVTVFTAAQLPYAPDATHSGTETPMMYPVHPYRLATILQNVTIRRLNGGKNTSNVDGSGSGEPDDLVQVGRDTYFYGHGNNGNTGWNQQPINLAYLGLRDEAFAAVVERALSRPDAMRFPAYLPSMQDFRPNEDHLSNMRVALQAMLVQHGDGHHRAVIGLLPAWPCDRWSVSFKVHLPNCTVVQGNYNHTTRHLVVEAVTPPERAADLRVLGCVNVTSGGFVLPSAIHCMS